MGALLISTGLGAVASADAASPEVTPATGGNGVPVVFAHTTFDLSTVGYAQSEFFLSGTARAYTSAAALTPDGKWSVTPSSPAAYKTRIVVNRPIDRRDFNGTVVVEWLNVTGGADASPDWIHMHNELVREGYAWVGVSAQAVGVNALQLPPCPPVPTAPCGDAARYGTLTHPGDSYSYDIFSQAGQAVRDNASTILGGLRVKRLIGVGESQSAGRLTTYINAAHPVVDVYDAFLVHSRGASGSALSQGPLPVPSVSAPTPTFIRDDLNVPVLVFQDENDVGGLQARQPDSRKYRLWEVAGTAHFDHYGLALGWDDRGERESVAQWFESMRHPTNQPSPNFTCDVPINTGPQTFVLRAAIDAVNKWITWGTPPPIAPRLQTITGQPLPYAFDADGIVRGGIRTPAVDAPVARLSGFGQTGGTQFCNIFGTTVPFTEQRLEERYRSHGGFVFAWSIASLVSAFSGFVEPEDVHDIWVVGVRSDVLR
jgi:hypothetical protein